jgi:DNA-binding NtrC family response regulator
MVGVGGPSTTAQTAGDILLVDDEADIRDGVAALLQAKGYRVRRGSI